MPVDLRLERQATFFSNLCTQQLTKLQQQLFEPATIVIQMYSRDETVKAILTFYQQLIKHPYLDESALKIPPANGWDTIDTEALRALGKTGAVIDLLRHLPYLDGRSDGYLIAYETFPVDFTISSTAMTEEVYPIPGHCVYLTEGLGREGYRLILDTEKGKVYFVLKETFCSCERKRHYNSFQHHGV